YVLGVEAGEGVAKTASRRTASSESGWLDSYYADEGTQNYASDLGEAQVFPTMEGNPMEPTGKWGWDVVIYDDPVNRPYGEERDRETAKAKALEALNGGQQALFASKVAGIFDYTKQSSAFDPGWHTVTPEMQARDEAMEASLVAAVSGSQT